MQIDRAGLPIRVETGPHYLGFADSDIADGNTLLKCMPPIRDKANQQGLFQGLKVLAMAPTAIIVVLAKSVPGILIGSKQHVRKRDEISQPRLLVRAKDLLLIAQGPTA